MSFGKAVQDPYDIVIYYEDVGKRNYFPSNSNQYGLNILTFSNGTKVRSTRKSLRTESPYHSFFFFGKKQNKTREYLPYDFHSHNSFKMESQAERIAFSFYEDTNSVEKKKILAMTFWLVSVSVLL